MADGMTITERHRAMWAKADPITKPSAVAEKPTYSAWHRQKAERVIEREPEAEPEAPEMGQSER